MGIHLKLSSGGIAGTVADPKLIYAAVPKLNSVSLILCHNHPSAEVPGFVLQLQHHFSECINYLNRGRINEWFS
ncbi:MAG: hypothetical protein ICV53_16685 [Flavisolibacter sp.]|nr:hypothetical protein [Flavisolibacter sp.]